MEEPGSLCRSLLDFVACLINPRVCFLLLLLLFSIFFEEFAMSSVGENERSPPAPAPPPSQHHYISCESDLKGIGSLDTTCQLNSDLEIHSELYIEGKGNFYILPGISVQCLGLGCSVSINISGNFSLGANSVILAGTFYLVADNATFSNGSVVNTTAMAGSPPSQTSGTPQGIDGAGGGHGGRGACCLTDQKKLPEDVWGGDAYSWSTLQNPWSYGSRGGTTNKEVDYGGAGGGRIRLEILRFLLIDGSILTDGGNGGIKGGGGSAGSVFIKAYKMIGEGKISCSGGDGFAGGGGGRVSMDIYSRHDDPKVYVHGGQSFGCPENSGAAGSFYDAVPRSLIINNYNRSTDTDTLLLEFPYQPLWTNIYVRNHAKASVPLLWSRVQVQGQISLSCGGVLSFGLSHYALSEFELLAEELLMSDSTIKVYGALRVLAKMFLMWNSKMIIDGGGDATVATSLLEGSNLIVLKESSVIHSNANLGVHGQGLLNLSGPGDLIEAQRLILSLFYSIYVGPGSVLRAPLLNPTRDYVTPRLYCDDLQGCPAELFHPPEDCNVNSSLPFTLQVCRVEDVTIEGLIKGSVVHFHRARSVSIQPSGVVCSSGMGCTGGIGRGKFLSNGFGSGAGHGGRGGDGCSNGNCIQGGKSYGNADLPCELGSGSGDEKFSDYTAGGGIIVMGSLEHPLSSLYLDGTLRADGGSSQVAKNFSSISCVNGGGSGGTVLLFVGILSLGGNGVLSSVGGNGSSYGGGGGGGGRIHFHWSDIPSGDVYQPIAKIQGSIHMGGGLGADFSYSGQNGTLTGRACPKGLFGVFCRECPLGTYKNVSGSDRSLCKQCPVHELPHRAIYVAARGGISETPCPYKCISDRYHMPHCYTALEELIHTFGGPWLFGIILLGLLVLLALVLSVARIKFVGVDELPGPTPTQHGSQIDHSFPFLESLNEVLETNRAEESHSHVHRMYFLGPNTFSEPWQLPHTPPEQLKEIVFEGAFNRFVDEINIVAGYQWWEGSVYTILSTLTYPLAWSWQQWRRKVKLQRLREFVRSEYDHACLRSCRCRALYEGLKVAATADLMLAHVDFFLGGDEKRADLPPCLQQRFPLSLLFGGDGSYMAPFSIHSDNIITNLLSQVVPPTTWYRLIAGLNAHLRLVRRGRLRSTLKHVIKWVHTHANPALNIHGLRLHLASFQYTTCGYSQFGILVVEANEHLSPRSVDSFDYIESYVRQPSRGNGATHMEKSLLDRSSSEEKTVKRRKGGGQVLESDTLATLKENRGVFYLVSFVVRNTKPVGHQDVVGLVISMLLLGDITLVLLTLLQLYSVSLGDVLLVLLILPLGILFPFPAGINALLSHGPRRSAGLSRGYALWNMTSLINVGVAFICGLAHWKSRRFPSLQKWNLSMDDGEWWVFSGGLALCKMLQSQLINWHIANLEIPDASLYTTDVELFWQS